MEVYACPGDIQSSKSIHDRVRGIRPESISSTEHRYHRLLVTLQLLSVWCARINIALPAIWNFSKQILSPLSLLTMPIEIVGIIQTIIAIALATELERHRDRSDDHPPGTCRNGARKAVGMKTKKYRVKPRMPVSTPNSNQPVLSTEEAVNAWMERMAERERRYLPYFFPMSTLITLS